ncbi:hypothetical protein [Streptomyces sp. NPDC127038]|uniref:hypothetical protein n=1 Tax=Streptomyces sp. NPDC127038 TaxID=3347114 RepID=UPI0036502558
MKYVRRNWRNIDRMSGASCDIHPTLDQLWGSADSYAILEIEGGILSRVPLNGLPGMIFWKDSSSKFISFRNWGRDEITHNLRIIFHHIHENPSIRSVEAAARHLERAMEERNPPEPRPEPRREVHMVFHGPVTGVQQGDHTTQNIGIQPEQIPGMFQQLRSIVGQLPDDRRTDALIDVEVVEDETQPIEERQGAMRRIMAAVQDGMPPMVGAAVLSGLAQLLGMLPGT